MLEIVVQVIVGLLVLTGSLLTLVAALGLHRFPDLLCRMHAATKPATLGMVCIALGAAISLTGRGALIKLVLVVALQFLTAPVAAHMIGRAAYRSGIRLSDRTVTDELGHGRQRPHRYGART